MWCQGYFVYDHFANDAGEVGAITLPAAIPTGALVLRSFIKKQTAIAGAGSSLALAIGGVALKATTVFDNAFFTAATANTAVTPAATSTATALTVTISGAVVTAGKFDIVVEYAV